MTALKLIIEGIILGGLLVVYCLVGIRGGVVGMAVISAAVAGIAELVR